MNRLPIINSASHWLRVDRTLLLRWDRDVTTQHSSPRLMLWVLEMMKSRVIFKTPRSLVHIDVTPSQIDLVLS
jgi:hypothetical protein